MASSNQCEFCLREFSSQKIVRVVQGTRHVFCSVSCFVCWRYNRPSSQGHAFYEIHTVRVPGEKLEDVLVEILPDVAGASGANSGHKEEK